MVDDSKKTDSAISKVIEHNPLAEATKKPDVASVISDKNTNLSPNQISPQLDKFENLLIQKKKYNE